MRQFLFRLCIYVAVVPCVQAGDGFTFLTMRTNPRATGLGETIRFTDWLSVDQNPSAASHAAGRGLSFAYFNHLLDVQTTSASGVWPMTQTFLAGGVVGGNLVYTSYGDFDGFDDNGNATSTYSASDVSLSAFYARPYGERWRWGTALKFAHSSIGDYSASGLAIDVGVQYEKPALTIGGGLTNVGFALDAFDKDRESLPLGIHVAAEKRWTKVSIHASWFDFHRSGSFTDRIQRLAAGAEYKPIEELALRVGYNHATRQELSLTSGGTAGLSGGVGFKYKRYVFDYAVTTWRVGTLHRFSITTQL
jgi:hypothetical protein